jgi:hypothetical protein
MELDRRRASRRYPPPITDIMRTQHRICGRAGCPWRDLLSRSLRVATGSPYWSTIALIRKRELSQRRMRSPVTMESH